MQNSVNAPGTNGLSMDKNPVGIRPRIIFFVGGARSGKSSLALRKAEEITGRKLFIATAEPLDDEMRERIDRHKQGRDKKWDTAEIPIRICETLKKKGLSYGVVLIDCLTLWLSNLMDGYEVNLNKDEIEKKIDAFVVELAEIKRSAHAIADLSCIVLVSNEVGMGIVPDNKPGRIFRDMAGRLNQKVAGLADEVYFVACGIPLRMKG